MRVYAILLIASLALHGAAPATANPLAEFFRYERVTRPVAGECGAIAAEVGAASTWYGQYSGKRYDHFTDNSHPFSARGCFKSELACRIWQGRLMTYAEGGPVTVTRCRPGAGGGFAG